MGEPESFAAWLRRELDARGWTQMDLARRAGVCQTTVTHWASGKVLPSRDNRAEIARAFGIPVEAVPPTPPRRTRWAKAVP